MANLATKEIARKDNKVFFIFSGFWFEGFSTILGQAI
jgi:hypothetical protein